MAVISVLVPWRPTPDREPIWAMLRERWAMLGYEVVEGTCPTPEWRKGAAVAAAADEASGELLVVADADVWCDIYEAVDAVHCGAAWAVPHFLVRRFDHEGGPAERPYRGRVGGGLVVLTRAALEQVPMDPRFAGWGHEDEAWGVALTTMLGRPWRGTADLHHYWHEPQQRRDRGTGSPDNVSLLRRYTAAARDQRTMTQLLDEARRWPDGGPAVHA